MMAEKVKRPFDLLEQSIGKKVLISLKNKSTVTGELKAFDAHFNLWLDQAEMKNEPVASDEKFKTILVRGDSIVFVSPV